MNNQTLEDNFRIVITHPFRRPLGYECATKKEAEDVCNLIRILAWDGELVGLGIPYQTQVETIIVPTTEFRHQYDA